MFVWIHCTNGNQRSPNPGIAEKARPRFSNLTSRAASLRGASELRWGRVARRDGHC